MYLHANAKLGLAGRLALVRAIEEGLSLKAAAAAFHVSPAERASSRLKPGVHRGPVATKSTLEANHRDPGGKRSRSLCGRRGPRAGVGPRAAWERRLPVRAGGAVRAGIRLSAEPLPRLVELIW
jgi:hypothetical protein